jgi:hypothetical protein
LFLFFWSLKTGFAISRCGLVTFGILRKRRNAEQKHEDAEAEYLQRFSCHLGSITLNPRIKYAKKQAKIRVFIGNLEMAQGRIIMRPRAAVAPDRPT